MIRRVYLFVHEVLSWIGLAFLVGLPAGENTRMWLFALGTFIGVGSGLEGSHLERLYGPSRGGRWPF